MKLWEKDTQMPHLFNGFLDEGLLLPKVRLLLEHFARCSKQHLCRGCISGNCHYAQARPASKPYQICVRVRVRRIHFSILLATTSSCMTTFRASSQTTSFL